MNGEACDLLIYSFHVQYEHRESQLQHVYRRSKLMVPSFMYLTGLNLEHGMTEKVASQQ
jgi:hypothetical protein